MTYPYGALAMLCFALTDLYTMLVVPLLAASMHDRTLAFSVHLFSTSFIFSIFLSFFLPFSLISLSQLSLASSAFFHASLYLIRFIASTILEFSAR